MDEVREPRWQAVLLGSDRGAGSAHYRRASLVLILTVVGGLISINALNLATMELLERARDHGLRRFLPLDRWMDLFQLGKIAMLIIIGLHFLWYLVHRLLPRGYYIIAHIAVVFLLLTITCAFSLGIVSPSTLTAFNLLVILFYPIIGWPLILTVTFTFLLVKLTHNLLFGIPLPPGSLTDHVLVISLLLAISYHFRSFGARCHRYIKEAQSQLEQFRSIRSLFGNGLLLINPDLTIRSKANHQARYLLGAPLEKGSHFPDVIVELAEQGQYLKEQIESFFRVLEEKILTDSERANINPMRNLRIFYPGGSRYLSFDVQKINQAPQSPFMVSIVDVSSRVELQKRRTEWLAEEFHQAELMRSFLMDPQTLDNTVVELRSHYLSLDRLIFEDRHRTSAQQHNPHEFARQVEEELLWLHSTMSSQHFSHLAGRAAQCQQQVQDYEDNSSYYNLLHLYTNIQLLIIELRRLRKVMLSVLNLHQETEGSERLSIDERERLMVLMRYLWSELDSNDKTG